MSGILPTMEIPPTEADVPPTEAPPAEIPPTEAEVSPTEADVPPTETPEGQAIIMEGEEAKDGDSSDILLDDDIKDEKKGPMSIADCHNNFPIYLLILPIISCCLVIATLFVSSRICEE